MTFKIKRRAIIPQHLQGAGDVVAMVAEPIKRTLMQHSPEIVQKMLANCNCNKRREALNKLLHFDN